MQIKHPYSNTAHYTTNQLKRPTLAPNPCAGSTQALSPRKQKREKLIKFCINCPNQSSASTTTSTPCDGICKELIDYEKNL